LPIANLPKAIRRANFQIDNRQLAIGNLKHEPDMKLLAQEFEGSGDNSSHCMEAHHSKDEETFEDDVNYSIADCRKRLRSRRSTLRAQDHPPKDGSNGQREEAVIT
jgi:hypothetical protein